ncbi:MAG: cadmium-translocating P-type ATPase [Rhizobiales bacterium]|nr:cadmium-translocating P-type ATPase [Hyphomicrobiales bacterium]
MNSPAHAPHTGDVAADPAPASVETAVLVIPSVHCAGCISRIERSLLQLTGVETARVNLSARQATVRWDPAVTTIDRLIAALEAEGFDARPLAEADPSVKLEADHGRQLLKALAVAGFAAGNVMLLSVSVWSGAEAATRDLLHWISALIALPAVVYAGRPFFGSAWHALTHRRLNMDVPISLAVILAAAMSLFETVTGGQHAYFDASVMLLFFLLSGRCLDHMMRRRARSAVTGLIGLKATSAIVVDDAGGHITTPISKISAGMQVLVPAGDRVATDGVIVEGHSDLDRSLITGEAVPEHVGPGSSIEAGTINISGPLTIEVTANGDDTVLAEIVSLMNAAEQGRARYVRLADRAARIYAPLVHIAALVTFLGWLWWSGDWHVSLLTAIAVLIITCPCALGLAVPAVHVVASGRLFGQGVLVKDGSALERLAEVDMVVFDKTGTLTTGKPNLVAMDPMSSDDLAIAAGLARLSSHPLAHAVDDALTARGIEPVKMEDVVEHPGYGMAAMHNGQTVRLGSPEWCRVSEDDAAQETPGSQLCLQLGSRPARKFTLEDALREDAAQAVAQLRRRGLRTVLLSGDLAPAVKQVARQVGIDEFHGRWKPQDKAAFIRSHQNTGRNILMVGDGLNDAPALGTAHVSMAPSNACDITGTAAGLVFLGSRLQVVPDAIATAAAARRLVRQNFAFAAAYNLVAVPIAVVGLASPLVAAIAMSASSLVVTANALRLQWRPIAATTNQMRNVNGRSKP